jgi:hypothetical protein
MIMSFDKNQSLSFGFFVLPMTHDVVFFATGGARKHSQNTSVAYHNINLNGVVQECIPLCISSATHYWCG